MFLGSISGISLKKGTHLTQTQKKILQYLIDNDLSSGGTKKIFFKIEKLNSKEYAYEIYEKYAIASRSFDLRPESKKVQWHYEGKGVISVK